MRRVFLYRCRNQKNHPAESFGFLAKVRYNKLQENPHMDESVYIQLAAALDALPNGFPRTASGVELRILAKIFSAGEALLGSQMSGEFEPAATIAEQAGLPVAEVKTTLAGMAKRSLVWFYRRDNTLVYRLAPFIVGIYEGQIGIMDHELAHLVEHYLREGGAVGIMQPQPALHRVVPVHGTVKSEWILPYEDVRALLLGAKTFHVGDCICRAQQDFVGRKCSFPVDSCLSFSSYERTPVQGDLTQEEALAFLDHVEELGLVHTVSNVMEGVGYVCNCCGCCCGILRGITDWGIQDSVAYANYYAVIDPEKCLACGTCITRCQVGAISQGDLVSEVEQARCIGCGLCVSGCPNEAVYLARKPEGEIVLPPKDFGEWEQARKENRQWKSVTG
jgi:Na+-translocating ferredoxin:NAD+ oxidoreductase subunit B